MTRYLLMGTAAALLFFSILCRFFPGMRLKRLLGGNGESFCFTEYNFTAMRVEIQQPVRIKRRQDEYIGLCGKISATVEIRTVQPAVLGQTWRAAFASVCFCRRNRSLHGADGGQTLGNVIWFYLQAFLSLYLYFAVIGMIDTASTAEELKITLADFLENRMSERLAQVKRDNDYLDEQEREVRREVESVEQTAAVRRMQEPRAAQSELTELLAEFLA